MLTALAVPPESTCLGEAPTITPASPSTARAQNGTACQGQATIRGQCWAHSLPLKTLRNQDGKAAKPRRTGCRASLPWSSAGSTRLPCALRLPDAGRSAPAHQSVLSGFGGERFSSPHTAVPGPQHSHRYAAITSLSPPNLVFLCAAEIHLPTTSQCGPPAPAKWSWRTVARPSCKWTALAGKQRSPKHKALTQQD